MTDRIQRLTLRLLPKRAKPCTQAGVDHFMRVEYRADTYYIQNLEYLDRGYDFDEFGDVDDEHSGLTIIEPMDDIELFKFCTGYHVL